MVPAGMNCLILLSLIGVRGTLALENGTDNKEATLGARLSMSGLQFFSDIGHKIVTHELPKLVIPSFDLPINDGPGKGTVHVSNLTLQKFESPHFHFELAPDRGITWNSQGGALRLTGNWKAEYDWLVSVSLKGTVDVVVTDIRSMLTLGAYGYDSHPQITVYECKTEVKNLHMTLSGGVIPWIINLFHDNLAKTIKYSIHQQLCSLVQTVLLEDANDALRKLPTRVEVTDNVFLDYGLIHNPVITNYYVEGDALLDVSVGNNTCSIPFEPVKLVAPERDNFMTNIWISQTVLDCLLDSVHKSKMLEFIIDRNLQKSLDTFLQTSCRIPTICIGEFFKPLRQNYPDEHIDLVFRSFTAPTSNISPDGITIQTTFDIDLHLYPTKMHPQILAQLQMNSTSVVNPNIVNDRVVGTLNKTEVTFGEMSSTIGHFNKAFLTALEYILKPMITIAVDTAFRVGIPIPLVENVTLANSTTLVALDKEIRIDANLLYRAENETAVHFD
uniref:BPI2 domain-containing protein n=1 Tax=Panagrellus redivivus TaxID=6233 RepID=A0A7E4VTX0_PANRE